MLPASDFAANQNFKPMKARASSCKSFLLCETSQARCCVNCVMETKVSVSAPS